MRTFLLLATCPLLAVVARATEPAPSAAPSPPPPADSVVVAPAPSAAVDAPAQPPVPAEPAAAPPEAPTTFFGEPAIVEAWTLVGVLSDRRLPDGRPTGDACGYERDVQVVARAQPGATPRAATLLVPCSTDPTSGLLRAGQATLRFPDAPVTTPKEPAVVVVQPEPLTPTSTPPATPLAPPPPAAVAAPCPAPVAGAPTAPPCKEPALTQRTCAEGEKPAVSTKPGEMPCKAVAGAVPFFKGELSHLGDVQLVNARSSVGVGLGLSTIDNVYYAQLRPDINVHVGQFALGLGAPLRFQLADFSQLSASNVASTGTVFANTGRFRAEDWDQLEDFLRPLRYVTWGKKEDNLYIDVNRVHAITLGHGQLMRRYTGNVDIDEDNLFAEVDAYGDFGGVELMAGPFPVPRLAGGLVFVKPLGLFLDDVTAKSWSVGVSAVADLNAPTGLNSRLNPADQRVQLAVDSTGQFDWPGRINPVGNVVSGVGVDSEVKVLKTDLFDIKVYGDYSHLFFPADTSAAQAFGAFDAGGATVGGLLRMSFGQTPVRKIEDETPEVQKGKAPREMKAAHALRVRLEGRAFEAQYLPSYFNPLYEVDRLQFGQTLAGERGKRAELPTKVAFLAQNAGQPWRAGLYLEASYAWVDAVAVTAVYEDAYAVGTSTKPVNGRNFALHAESQGLGFLQLFATYHYRNIERFDGIFSFNTDNEVLYGGGRLQLLPILFINAAVQRTFRTGFLVDDLARGDTVNRYSSVGLENVWSGAVDVEVGWQF